MSKDVSTKNFPESAEKSLVDSALEFVPTPLQTFLTLFSGKDVSLKLASLGQAIVQATRGNPVVAVRQIAAPTDAPAVRMACLWSVQRSKLF